MNLSRTVIGALAATLLATSANAALLYSNDFDAAATTGAGVTGGVSGAGVTGTANGATYAASGWSGNHLRNETTGNPASFTNFSFANLAAHTSVSASFVLGFLDSWDGTSGGFPQNDHLEIWVDGVLVADLSSNQASGAGPDYDGATLIAFGVQADNRFFFSEA